VKNEDEMICDKKSSGYILAKMPSQRRGTFVKNNKGLPRLVSLDKFATNSAVPMIKNSQGNMFWDI